MKVFDECDVDHSGTISWSEFKKYLGEKGFGLEFIEVWNYDRRLMQNFFNI